MAIDDKGLVEAAGAIITKLNTDLPVCPFDRRSPDYWTTANDKPCHVCGGTEDIDKCRGADLRCMGEAADLIARLADRLEALLASQDRMEGELKGLRARWSAAVDVYGSMAPSAERAALARALNEGPPKTSHPKVDVEEFLARQALSPPPEDEARPTEDEGQRMNNNPASGEHHG